MSLDALKSAIPDYARDLRRNLDVVIGDSPLSEQQLWGTVLATAIASRSPLVLRELAPEAEGRLSAEAYTAAKGAAAAMALSNVFHRTRHLLSDPEYGSLRTGLRMNVLRDPGVDRVDFELWSLAVSAVNACGACLDSHERALRRAGVEREVVQEAFRIAAVVQAVGVTVEAEVELDRVSGGRHPQTPAGG
ncbi:carboxymuconolactone decarboxylase family protein [Streptomyces ipomoeae]|jgi:alkyl hydroperoxide reductase subunit D|uniref:Alkyl hydroperoxide reductase AhpD n=2 Tax=Streptomyces ipomoeae TaxID=103232 RepID=L1KYX8_9ACTN|nr:carboxymuconolactone decarboxylase family protein [Streptomyces ipomoeae]EKX65558.1 alkylhydroperoxidase, AhpD family [Streptomyces ipomoeae 91-03]MDX2697093.1 carboxymuconolactone decarboxylase family protein [Streptomyces ipomoeae]MDX2826489.1 carboxymuconolactone decarboxylase family protein [Streptomyces ipomoeae]MDX2842393.1 carboxymuconolactone decarboxylase family protein [Streptomyces ipomoeae]MDX2872743.1 carboxymuconolactone decarboxylase family protein [Streptomyces ipomoeae]